MEHEANQGLETFTSLSVYAFRKSLESLVKIEVSKANKFPTSLLS